MYRWIVTIFFFFFLEKKSVHYSWSWTPRTALVYLKVWIGIILFSIQNSHGPCPFHDLLCLTSAFDHLFIFLHMRFRGEFHIKDLTKHGRSNILVISSGAFTYSSLKFNWQGKLKILSTMNRFLFVLYNIFNFTRPMGIRTIAYIC